MRPIDVDNLKARLRDIYKRRESDPRVREVRNEAKGIIDSLIDVVDEEPTVDTIKHAHWIRIVRSGSEYWQCSNCHGYFTLPMPKYRGFYMRYCGCCGAKMDEAT